MPYLKINNLKIEYNLKRSSRTRKINLKVKLSGDIEVVAPFNLPIPYIEDFIRNNQNWLFKQLEHFKKILDTIPQRYYETGEQIHYLGKEYTLVVKETCSKKAYIEFSNDKFLITLPQSTNTTEKHETIKILFDNWFRNEARKVINGRLEHFNKYYNFTYNKIFIKNQKTRWGSCSSLKNLNFNWRIIMAPLSILDYIVVHELCHLKEQNHSSAFWSLVEEQIPDYKKRKEWLKKNTMTLTFS